VPDRLAALNLGGDTLAALFLAPLVMVAWADGGIDDKERGAVLAGSVPSCDHRPADRPAAELPLKSCAGDAGAGGGAPESASGSAPSLPPGVTDGSCGRAPP
jgi:hypothetical protein